MVDELNRDPNPITFWEKAPEWVGWREIAGLPVAMVLQKMAGYIQKYGLDAQFRRVGNLDWSDVELVYPRLETDAEHERRLKRIKALEREETGDRSPEEIEDIKLLWQELNIVARQEGWE